MPVKITNLSNRPLVLTLSTGSTLHLAPRATSAELTDVEVKNNAKLDKLKDQFVISIHDTASRDMEVAQRDSTSSKSPEKEIAEAVPAPASPKRKKTTKGTQSPTEKPPSDNP